MKKIQIKEYMLLTHEERTRHINLIEKCIERGGNQRNILAQYLNTEMPKGWIAILCHKCFNKKCSNPKHLYWGTSYENNIIDRKEEGTYFTPWDYMVINHGEEKAKEIVTKQLLKICSNGGKGNKGKKKSESHKEKIRQGVLRFYNSKPE